MATIAACVEERWHEGKENAGGGVTWDVKGEARVSSRQAIYVFTVYQKPSLLDHVCTGFGIPFEDYRKKMQVRAGGG
jgi:hypothetical protein